MKITTREGLIEWLVRNDLGELDALASPSTMEWLSTILTSGFEGYANMTNAQLAEEVCAREDDEVDIPEELCE